MFTALNTHLVYTNQLFLRYVMFSSLRPHWKCSPGAELESVWLHDIRWLEHWTDPRPFLHVVTYSRISEYLNLLGSILASLHLTTSYIRAYGDFIDCCITLLTILVHCIIYNRKIFGRRLKISVAVIPKKRLQICFKHSKPSVYYVYGHV